MNLIKEKDGYRLYSSMNTWDANYHLLDGHGNDYLIDSSDIVDTQEELEEYEAMMLWSDFKELIDIEYIKDFAWKVVEVSDTLGLKNELDKITIL